MTDEQKRTRARRFIWLDGDFVVLEPGEQLPERKIDKRLRAGPVELGKIRRARNVTQTELAAAMGVDQAEISRLERRGDFRLSTVLNYLNGLDATGLEVTITFGDGSEMVLPMPVRKAS
jgi:DNA-binding transcriptional regulator YiaG